MRVLAPQMLDIIEVWCSNWLSSRSRIISRCIIAFRSSKLSIRCRSCAVCRFRSSRLRLAYSRLTIRRRTPARIARSPRLKQLSPPIRSVNSASCWLVQLHSFLTASSTTFAPISVIVLLMLPNQQQSCSRSCVTSDQKQSHLEKFFFRQLWYQVAVAFFHFIYRSKLPQSVSSQLPQWSF